MLYQTASSQCEFRSDGSCEGGQLSPNWYDGYAEFILEVSNPPSPNTTFSSTPESVLWPWTRADQYLLCLWYLAIKSIQQQVFIVKSSKLAFHSATWAVWPRMCRCAQRHAVGYILVPQYDLSIWVNEAALLWAEGLWQSLAFMKCTPHPSWLQVLWPSHSVFLQLVQQFVQRSSSSLTCLFFFFFFPLTDGQKRKKSLRKKLDSLGKEKNRDKGKIKWVHIYWLGLSFAYEISLVLNIYFLE